MQVLGKFEIMIQACDTDPWTSPDGKVSIWKVQTDKGEFKTMSKNIGTAAQGKTFHVEHYENDRGKEYIRIDKQASPAIGGVEGNDGARWGCAGHMASRIVSALVSVGQVEVKDVVRATIKAQKAFYLAKPDSAPQAPVTVEAPPPPEPNEPSAEDLDDVPW